MAYELKIKKERVKEKGVFSERMMLFIGAKSPRVARALRLHNDTVGHIWLNEIKMDFVARRAYWIVGAFGNVASVKGSAIYTGTPGQPFQIGLDLGRTIQNNLPLLLLGPGMLFLL